MSANSNSGICGVGHSPAAAQVNPMWQPSWSTPKGHSTIGAASLMAGSALHIGGGISGHPFHDLVWGGSGH